MGALVQKFQKLLEREKMIESWTEPDEKGREWLVSIDKYRSVSTLTTAQEEIKRHREYIRKKMEQEQNK